MSGKIQKENDNYIILRTSWVFSKDGKNFVNTILRLAKERDELKVVNDQFGGPTSAACIAEVLLQLATEHKEHWGIYHFSGQPFMSRHKFAEAIVARAIEIGLVDHEVQLASITSSELTVLALRPKNSTLNNTKLTQIFCIEPSEWDKELFS